jgi:uncharacterized protein
MARVAETAASRSEEETRPRPQTPAAPETRATTQRAMPEAKAAAGEGGVGAVAARLGKLPWARVEESLWQVGYAQTPRLLTSRQCAALVALYPRRELFRNRVEMERHRFGAGDYQYFAAPLPELVAALRAQAYAHLAPIANRWMEALGLPERYPPELGELAELCRRRGQTRPTPLLLHYEAGGYNCLHQDLYGDLAFPFQIVCMLSRPGVDFAGGELLLVEQRSRAQSVGQAIAPQQGEAVIFTTRYRPVRGARGFYRGQMRHGVSRIRAGTRYTLGLIFHDAR